jgi:2,3-bisphosphoglycerate-dependent phosphoglycerate mutase
MKILYLARHGQSLQNVSGVVNGDPLLDRGLSPLGVDQARALGFQLAGVSIDLCVTSSFPRAQETARLALGERARTTSTIVDDDLDDVRLGELEGETLEVYRAWKRSHAHTTPFPGGESLDETARRYASALERLLGRPQRNVLCICHEIPVRYAVNSLLGSGELDGPLHDVANATPYLFDADGVHRAVERMRELSRSPASRDATCRSSP